MPPSPLLPSIPLLLCVLGGAVALQSGPGIAPDRSQPGSVAHEITQNNLELGFTDRDHPFMIQVVADTFYQGSPPEEIGRGADETRHKVTLTRDFYLSQTEITQAQWEFALGSNPARFSDCPDCPVEEVSWLEAIDYCNALSALEGFTPAYVIDTTGVSWADTANGYRLPTEAEWEFACRAGSSSAFHSGGISNPDCADTTLEAIAWYCGNRSTPARPQAVRAKEPNAWHFHDLSGNVREWCWDWYEADYPTEDPLLDPRGPESGTQRVTRGGGYRSDARFCRSAGRLPINPASRYSYIGLRVARSIFTE
jgi:formylglycine-generating enzyme required for sulfatase activity